MQIIGQINLIRVDHIAGMLQALTPWNVGTTDADRRRSAQQETSRAIGQAERNGGTIAAAEDIFTEIFNRALDERSRLM